MEQPQISYAQDRTQHNFVSLSDILKSNFNINELVSFNAKGQYKIEGKEYIKETEDKDTKQSILTIASSVPTINGITVIELESVLESIKPFIDKKDEFFLPIIEGGFLLTKPQLMENKDFMTNQKVIAYDDVEVHEHIHAADHEKAFRETLLPWTQRLVDTLRTNFKNYDPDIHPSEDVKKVLDDYFEEYGDYKTILYNFINKTLEHAKLFHQREKDVPYYKQTGIQERDPRELYRLAKTEYSNYPVLMQKVEESEARYKAVALLKEQMIEQDKFNQRKRAIEQDKLFKENLNERNKNQEIIRKLVNLFESPSHKDWIKETKIFSQQKGLSIFELANDNVILSKEDKARLKEFFAKNKSVIEGIAEDLGITDKVMLLKFRIDDAEVVDWSKKRVKTDEDDKIEDLRTRRVNH